MDKALLLKSIIEYRAIGKELMFRLGNKYGLDISKEEDYFKLLSRDSIPRNGALSKKWNYAFHGMECGFHHRVTQQSIEVKLINPPHFGVIESWFLLSFLESTETYKLLAKDLVHCKINFISFSSELFCKIFSPILALIALLSGSGSRQILSKILCENSNKFNLHCT